MKRWQFAMGVLTTAVVTMIVAWIFLHQRVTNGGLASIAANKAKINALFANSGIDYVLIERADEGPVVFTREKGESDADFIARTDQPLGVLSLKCVTLTCGQDTVQLCIACMLGESDAHCQQRLDDLHATYCALHPNCTPCP